MKKNILGKTGLEVSAFGLGGHEYRWGKSGNLKDNRFTAYNPERKQVIKDCLDAGVNYFDTTFPEEVQSLGYWANKLGVADRIIINGMLIYVLEKVENLENNEIEPYITKYVENIVELLGRPFDIFSMTAIDTSWQQERFYKVFEIYQKLQKRGLFHHIGVTTHNPEHMLNTVLPLKSPIEAIMFKCNYENMQTDIMKKLTNELISQEIGMIAIKPFVWFHYGIPFPCYGEDEWDAQQAISSAISWQVNESPVHVTIAGVESRGELSSILNGTREKLNINLLKRYIDRGNRLDCVKRNAGLYGKNVESFLKQMIDSGEIK